MFSGKPKSDALIDRFDKEATTLKYAFEAEHDMDQQAPYRVRTYAGEVFKFRGFFFTSAANKERVTSVQLFAAFEGDPKPARQTDWNRNHRFIKAYAHDKQLHFEMDFSTLSIADEDLRFYLQTWHRGLQQGRDFDW